MPPSKRRTLLFTPEEDQRFIEIMSNNKNATWREVSAIFGNHTPRQCRDHWLTHLAPVVKTWEKWTPQEDDLLVTKVLEVGKNWSILAQFFKGRTESEIRSHWFSQNHRKIRTHLNDVNSNHLENNNKMCVNPANASNSNNNQLHGYDSANFAFNSFNSNVVHSTAQLNGYLQQVNQNNMLQSKSIHGDHYSGMNNSTTNHGYYHRTSDYMMNIPSIPNNSMLNSFYNQNFNGMYYNAYYNNNINNVSGNFNHNNCNYLGMHSFSNNKQSNIVQNNKNTISKKETRKENSNNIQKNGNHIPHTVKTKSSHLHSPDTSIKQNTSISNKNDQSIFEFEHEDKRPVVNDQNISVINFSFDQQQYSGLLDFKFDFDFY
ncbi:hypothetical protein TRFO_38874 [Tritrichomonas foetus]|uniref:Myb-like DNA-binding domain containing protein n=1 Tax=Tritrichomonas foetus TaxID=1144522 RepID=A0A1J4JC10_9EUKA|nr:hypothetical protein TRFO_38874 [Tritrichomonas foetus]|eukprot:OHS94949.1 hypothetical protein TRFO_38874 [Tritrichomonas foetus]